MLDELMGYSLFHTEAMINTLQSISEQGVPKQLAVMQCGGDDKLQQMLDEGSAISAMHGRIEMIYFPKIKFGKKSGVSSSNNLSRSKPTTPEACKAVDDMIERFSWAITTTQRDLEASVYMYATMCVID